MDKETNKLIKEIFEMYESMALNQEAKQMIKNIKEMYFEIEDYKQRIDKAIEHIEESLYILKGDSDIPITTGNVRNRYIKPLLNILRGEDENDSI